MDAVDLLGGRGLPLRGAASSPNECLHPEENQPLIILNLERMLRAEGHQPLVMFIPKRMLKSGVTSPLSEVGVISLCSEATRPKEYQKRWEPAACHPCS